MIADKIQNLDHYSMLSPYAQDIQAFIAKMGPEVADGRYDLQGDDLFALVQRYTSKPMEGALMESHKLYADLQYIHSGKEWIYVDYAEDLKAVDDRTPGADIIFYETTGNKGGSLLSAGTFGYYAPQDAHEPGIMDGAPEEVCKIVFKIRVK